MLQRIDHIFQNLFVYFHIASNSLSTSQILGITFGSLVLCVAIFGIIYTNLKKRRRASRRNERVAPQSLAMGSIYRDVTHAPYTISRPTKPVTVQEELPPSYEAYMSSVGRQEQPDRF